MVSKDDGDFIWNVNDGSHKVRLEGGGGVTFSADGKRAATGTGLNIVISDAQSGEPREHLQSKGYIIFVEFALDNVHLISADYQGAVRSWRVK